jgi:hypothetical protein
MSATLSLTECFEVGVLGSPEQAGTAHITSGFTVIRVKMVVWMS